MLIWMSSNEYTADHNIIHTIMIRLVPHYFHLKPVHLSLRIRRSNERKTFLKKNGKKLIYRYMIDK